jgi:hypothetical protein
MIAENNYIIPYPVKKLCSPLGQYLVVVEEQSSSSSSSFDQPEVEEVKTDPTKQNS